MTETQPLSKTVFYIRKKKKQISVLPHISKTNYMGVLNNNGPVISESEPSSR